MAENRVVCQEHVWELRAVSFDLEIGALDELECTHCSAATFRQSASRGVPGRQPPA